MMIEFLFALGLWVAPVGAAAAPPPITIVAVRASSALPPWKGYTFDAANLIDGRVDTSWQPAKGDTMGVGQWVELDLGAPHAIDRIEIAHGLQKVDAKLGDLFCRNTRVAEAAIVLDDGTWAPHWAPPGDTVSSVESFYRGEALPGKEVKGIARYLRLVVTTVHDPVDWQDLAIAELRVYGKPAPAPAVDAASIAWDRPGVWPLKAATLDACAANAATRARRDCSVLVAAVIEGRALDVASFAALPPVAVADLDKGAVLVTFAAERMRHRLELARGADGRWAVKRHTRLDATGRAAAPVSRTFVEEDEQHRNPCWEKLGKPRPDADSGEPDGADLPE